jgi:hypothetical protein
MRTYEISIVCMCRGILSSWIAVRLEPYMTIQKNAASVTQGKFEYKLTTCVQYIRYSTDAVSEAACQVLGYTKNLSSVGLQVTFPTPLETGTECLILMK